MINDDRTTTLLGPLARVAPGARGLDASTPGAGELLDSIMTAAPVPAAARRPRYGLRRLAVGLAAAAVLAGGIVVGPSLLEDGGGATSYASSEIDVRREGDEYVALIKDPYADAGKYQKAFEAVGMNVELLVVPVSPSRAGKVVEFGRETTGDHENGREWTTGMVDAQGRDCRAGQGDCRLLLRFPAIEGGKTVVKLGREARPGETYDSPGRAVKEGEDLAGADVYARKVSDVVAQARERGVSVEYGLLIPHGPDKGYHVDPITPDRVGGDWTVWEAESVKDGTVRLLVTRERLDYNPVYGMDLQENGRPKP
ncbi:hypothetical protein [Bailinhaonella thermotolerans]|uniref:hypothetical protein n=1 Tax=Bailinhaonella thermotolerans TaxID=1070861 RepID=UPI00192A4AD2|nr:hypothetical protein [Bailinhaonella thermotolerans]